MTIDPTIFESSMRKIDTLGLVDEGNVLDYRPNLGDYECVTRMSWWPEALELLPQFRAAGLIENDVYARMTLTVAGRALLQAWTRGPAFRVLPLPPRPRTPMERFLATTWTEDVGNGVEVHRMRDADDRPEAMITAGGRRVAASLSAKSAQALAVALLSVTR